MTQEYIHKQFASWRQDWCLFAEQMLQVKLDPEQAAILRSIQQNKMTSVVSGTARGKDFVSAVAALCFLYLTPKWKNGELIENTKVALTAPTDRQIQNIMVPEFTRLFTQAKHLPGRLTGYDIRTDYKDWFLTGFKADENTPEAWTGFHAVHTMFIVTEASGISDKVFEAIEGNLQADSRLVLVFNANVSTGYAAASQRSPRWHKFRLNSLNAPNVVNRNNDIPGQVDYDWVNDKVKNWCSVISEADFIEEEGDFYFENEDGGFYYRPNDLFRIKVLGLFPKVASDVLIPLHWIEAAQRRYKEFKEAGSEVNEVLRLGVDVAGMGRDSSAFCFKYGNLVDMFEMIHSGGTANHMQIAGKVKSILSIQQKVGGEFASAYIDTIGEGAGVYSRLKEQNTKVFSVKNSESAVYNGKELKDITGQYSFLNMRAWLLWAVRDWLNPINKTGAMLPPDDELTEEMTETKWEFVSSGKIKIEPKEDIKKRLGRSPDKFDALANTFHPGKAFKPTDLSKFGFF